MILLRECVPRKRLEKRWVGSGTGGICQFMSVHAERGSLFQLFQRLKFVGIPTFVILSVGETRSPCKFSVATAEVTMLHVLEPADRIDLTNGAKTCIFNLDGVFGIHRAKSDERIHQRVADVHPQIRFHRLFNDSDITTSCTDSRAGAMLPLLREIASCPSVRKQSLPISPPPRPGLDVANGSPLVAVTGDHRRFLGNHPDQPTGETWRL
jgi:hypothetical protein